MWNSLCTIWRTLNNVVWILTTLILFYFLYSISDGRFRFIFWQSKPVINVDEAKQPELMNPRNENPVDE